MDTRVRWLLLMALGVARGNPVLESSGLTDLGQRLGVRAQLPAPAPLAEPRLPLPTAQDVEAIRKVAQILVMLGEQHKQRDEQNIETLNVLVDTLRPLTPKARKSRKPLIVIPAITGDIGASLLAPHAMAPHAMAPPAATVNEIPNDPVATK